MKPDVELSVGPHALGPGPVGRTKPADRPNDFAARLSNQDFVAQTLAERDEIIARQPPKSSDENAQDLAFIRENGMQAFVEKVRQEKRDELRAAILKAMGLSEEDLQAMSPEMRRTIEELIDREIEERMAANSLVNDGEDKSGDAKLEMGQASTSAPLMAQILAGDGDGASGLAMMEVVDRSLDGAAQHLDDET